MVTAARAIIEPAEPRDEEEPPWQPFGQYIVFDAAELLGRRITHILAVEEVEKALVAALGSGLSFAVDSLPWAKFVPHEPMDLPFVPQNVAVLVSPGEAEAHAVRDAVEALIAKEGGKRISGVGADPTVAIGGYSSPGAVEPALFGTRTNAHRLIGIAPSSRRLYKPRPKSPPRRPARQRGERGRHRFRSGLLAISHSAGPKGSRLASLPGWTVQAPWTTSGDYDRRGFASWHDGRADHPRRGAWAVIWDVPLIRPPRINRIGLFLSGAHFTYWLIIQTILAIQANDARRGRAPQQWVFVNAWAIYDRRSEVPFFRDYTENLPGFPDPIRHPFIRLIDEIAANRFDIIFCAGNCGGVCPDGRCGPNDFGPGRGIWGANAHPSVLTVGAVRTDTNWIGYSSEGPGPGRPPFNKLASQKPDLCAPSHYEVTGGDIPPNRGSSAAAALAAGVVSAFRSKTSRSQAAVAPANLINALNNSAQRINGPPWNCRIGNGILDARAASAVLPP